MSHCIEWDGPRSLAGYGVLPRGANSRLAHRAAWEASVGPIPRGMELLHTCDNPPCVNLDHLKLGTHAENMADMVAKGRSASGERHSQAKLTSEDARQIKCLLALGVGGTWIGPMFGIHRTNVTHIKNGTTWVSA